MVTGQQLLLGAYNGCSIAYRLRMNNPGFGFDEDRVSDIYTVRSVSQLCAGFTKASTTTERSEIEGGIQHST